jgi:ATP/maltotriose-dependent transcriptional regulator MalT
MVWHNSSWSIFLVKHLLLCYNQFAIDPRFTPDEAVVFFQKANLNLAIQAVQPLNDRTEGWIARLQLAALSGALCEATSRAPWPK